MKVLLRDTVSQEYLAPHGSWTAVPSEAVNFVSPRRAWRAAKTDPSLDLTVVLYFSFISKLAAKFRG
jgi:hypothetical protein